MSHYSDSIAVHKSEASNAIINDSTVTLVTQSDHTHNKQVSITFSASDLPDTSAIRVYTEGNATYIYPGSRRPLNVLVTEHGKDSVKDSLSTALHTSSMNTSNIYDSTHVIVDDTSKHIDIAKSKIPVILIVCAVVMAGVLVWKKIS